MKATLAQYRLELSLSLRNGEQLLVNLLIPLGLLLFFSNVKVLASGTVEPVDQLAPAVLALAVMSSSLVSLGIGTGFERYYGVLKRLGATPLGRPRWLTAKFASILTIELAQWVVLIVTALLLGWDPDTGWLAAIAAAALGTAAFGGIAMTMAGSLKGLTNLALCNGLYLVLMVTGGMIVPLDNMPDSMQTVARAFPAAPLADLIIGALQQGADTHPSSWWVLGAWAIAMPLVAARTFNWD